MQLDGWTWEDCILETPTGIHINWPKMDVYKSRWDDTPEEEIQKNIKKHLTEIERYMDDAYAYSLAKAEGKNTGIDLRWEGMIPLLKKEIPAFIHAQRFAQIDASINFSLRYDLRIVIVGGADADMLTHRLVEHNIPVIYEHPLSTPLRRWEPYYSKYTVPRNLYDAGVKFCISYSSSTFQAPHQRSLPYAAAMAVSFGLPLKEGLRAITLSAAEILGVGDRVGSLDVGKDATLFITNGDPLQMDSQVEMAFIQGRVVDLNDRHKTLSDKYREKYRQLNIIK
jgi:imidazolonepropionase-like amidohydrolase